MTAMTPDLERDREEVMKLHNGWLDANRQGSIELMRSVFVGGLEVGSLPGVAA